MFVIAQTRFSKVHSNIGSGPGINILVTDTGYTSISRYIYSNSLIDFMNFDSQGNLLSLVSGSDTMVSANENGDKSLIGRHGQLYLGNNKFISSDSGYVTVVKLSPQYDTLKLLVLVDYQGYDTYMRAMEFDTDTTLIVTGFLYRNTGIRDKYDFWAARIDTAFNVLWQQRVEDNRPGMNGGYTGLDIVVDNYGSLLVTGAYNVDFAAYQAVNRSFAARLDQKTGKVHWLKEYRHPLTDTGAGASHMFALDEGNGTYSFVDAQYFHFIPNNIIRDSSQLRFGYMDTTGTILWDTLIGPTVQQYEPRDLHKTPSGNYYTAGLMTDYGPFMSFGFVIDPGGDSINYVIHRHKDSVQNQNAIIRENLWNFQPTPDGGFIHIGNWVDPDTMQNIVHTWLLKTDEYGCKVEGCEIGLPERALYEASLNVFPNPSNGKFHLTTENTSFTEMQLEVYNMLGQLIYKASYSGEDNNIIDLSSHAAGTYILHIKKEGSYLTHRKLIVE